MTVGAGRFGSHAVYCPLRRKRSPGLGNAAPRARAVLRPAPRARSVGAQRQAQPADGGLFGEEDITSANAARRRVRAGAGAQAARRRRRPQTQHGIGAHVSSATVRSAAALHADCGYGGHAAGDCGACLAGTMAGRILTAFARGARGARGSSQTQPARAIQKHLALALAIQLWRAGTQHPHRGAWRRRQAVASPARAWMGRLGSGARHVGRRGSRHAVGRVGPASMCPACVGANPIGHPTPLSPLPAHP